MIRIEKEESGKIVIETGLVRVEILENIKWKSNKRTDEVNFYIRNGAEIETSKITGNYAGEIRITKPL